MAVRQPGVWGIDLGQCALKAIRLEMKDGEPVATAFEYIEHPKILSQPDADPDELTREALHQFLSRNQIRGDIIAISVPGQSGLARFVKLPPVDEKKIADIVKFEAKQQIPFPLEEVVWDFQRLNKGDIIDGLALETEIGLFAMKRDMVTRAIAQFKDVGVEVHLVQMAPLALCNFIAFDLLGKGGGELAEEDDSHECIVALEIGTDASNLVITDGGRIIWQRPIPIGGNHFTRALTKEMKLTFAKAEHLKKNAAKSPDLKKILSSLKQVLNDFVGEVQRSLGYFTNTHRNASIQYMVGLGNAFRLPGLQKFLQEKLQLEVRKLQKLQRTTGESVTGAPTFAENIMSFGVAYGLALQGLKQAHLQTNLLPYEVRLERVIRGKKPWVVAAAASLLFGMCVLAFAEGVEKNAVINEDIKKQEKQLVDVHAEVDRLNKELADEEAKLKKHLLVLERIGGVEGRMNWQLLHQYINRASPQPDGGRLSKKAQGLSDLNVYAKRWENNKDAQQANLDFQYLKSGENRKLTPEQAAANDVFIKRNLIQINIAGINALYTDDLGPYFRKIITDTPVLFGMSEAEKGHIKAFREESDAEKQKSSPLFKQGKGGWVVEIRGYTYHKDGFDFVAETILQNLRFPGDLKDAKDEELIEMSKRVKDKVSYLFVFENRVSAGGQKSEIVNKSFLKPLVRGDAAGGGGGGQKGPPVGVGKGPGMQQPGGPQQGPGDADKGGDEKDKFRDQHWRPLDGTEAARIFGDNVIVRGAGGGGEQPGGQPGGPNPGMKKSGFADKGPMGKDGPEVVVNQQAVPRTEFVILFVWREPILAQQTPAADDKK